MSDLLPAHTALRISQSHGSVGARAVADLDHLIVIVPQTPRASAWESVPDGTRLRREFQRLGADEHRLLRSRLNNAAGTGITVARLPKPWRDASHAFPCLKFAGELVAEALASQPRTLGLLIAGVDAERAGRLARAVTLAAGASAFQLPEFRRKRSPRPRLQRLRLLGIAARIDTARLLAEIEAANLARWLTALPPNRLTAASYRELVGQMAEHHEWNMRFLDTAALKRLGAGAFLAVAQGNATPDAGIVHLSWRPRGRSRPDVALVGKGIIFDTGGTNLKPFRAMLDMHQDMCGSAVALAVLLAVTRLKLPLAIDCWLAITENRLSERSYKSRDVVSAADGTSIEVIHTDAEGRMALADTLALAARERPRLLLDYATLTGQCINALTDRYSGVFSNRPALADLLVQTGRACGERVWTFPMDEDFDEELKSTVADVAQCSVENEGDHILAARFLQRFVPETLPWAHIDLSAATRKKGLGQVPAGPTGFGVRLTLALLGDRGADLDSLLGAPPARG
ncbi:MAG: leucyl aminopeptidase family protein [Gammaproteobacteria bacterium]|nr:MAG: leucyl aminopeptidase family protein [Gammaproteobacteria bacterium]